MKFKLYCAFAALLVIAVFCFNQIDSEPKHPLPDPISNAKRETPKRNEINSALSSSTLDQPPPKISRHKIVRRKFSLLDKTILGQEPHIDSRASRRIFENRVLDVVGKSSGLTLLERVDKLKNLSVLSEEEQKSLFDAIHKDELPEGISRSSWNWIVDVMMISLRSKGASAADITQNFTKVYQNSNIDLTVRDYALQHLGHLKGEGGNEETIQQILRSARSEKNGTLAGTALLAIDNITDFAALTPEEIQDRALSAYAIASNLSFSLESRVTAIQVAAKHDPAIVADLAQSILNDSDSPQILKLSAQAALNKK